MNRLAGPFRIAIGAVTALLLLLGGTHPAPAQDDLAKPVLVKDIRTGGGLSSWPGKLVEVNGAFLFFADDGYHGYELWRSDGTPEGTALVKDIWPNSQPHGDPSYTNAFAAFGDILVFGADDGEHGTELWRSDGTAEGTYMVKDLRPGDQSAGLSAITVAGNRFYFFGPEWNEDGEFVSQISLWVSDGTEGGTKPVKRFDWGDVTSDYTPVPPVVIGNTIFFAQRTEATGWELWKSNGASDSTVMIKNVAPGAAASRPLLLTAMNGRLYFTAEDSTGRELWRSDGTPNGTARVKDIYPGPYGSSPDLFAVAGPYFYFWAYTEKYGLEPWRSDGSPAGTILLKNISPGTNSSYPPSDNYSENYAAVFGNAVLFRADDGVHGREWWRTNGEPSGTELVVDAVTTQDSYYTIGFHSAVVDNLDQVRRRQFFLGMCRQRPPYGQHCRQ